jgi:hypothetical protein
MYKSAIEMWITDLLMYLLTCRCVPVTPSYPSDFIATYQDNIALLFNKYKQKVELFGSIYVSHNHRVFNAYNYLFHLCHKSLSVLLAYIFTTMLVFPPPPHMWGNSASLSHLNIMPLPLFVFIFTVYAFNFKNSNGWTYS